MFLNKFFKKTIFLGANLLLAVTPFLFTWFNVELFEFNKMLFVYGITIVITTAWIGRMITAKKIIFKHTFLDWAWLAFLLSNMLATFFSLHPYTSIFGYYSRFHGGLLSTLSYALLYWAFVSNFNKNQVLTLLKTAVLAGIGVSLYAIPEKLGMSPSCFIISGRFNDNCWMQDVRHRVFATFGQPNWLGAYLAMLLPLGISFHLHTVLTPKTNFNQSTLFNLLRQRWLLGSLAIFLALLFTQSRSALLAIAVSLMLMLGCLVKSGSTLKTMLEKKFKLQTASKKAMVSLILLIAGLTVVVGTDFTHSLGRLLPIWRPDSTTEDPIPPRSESNKNQQAGITITPSEKIRLIVWQGALKIWQRYPWLGSGPETFAYTYYLDRPQEHNLVSEWDFLYNKAHNELLNLLATTGIVGLSTYLFLMGSCFYLTAKALWPTLTKQPHQQSNNFSAQQQLILSLGASLVGFNITNILGFSTVMVSVLWVFFMSYLSLNQAAAGSSSFTTSTQAANSGKKLSFFQIITLFWLGLIAFYLLMRLTAIWHADHLHFKGKQQLAKHNYSQGIADLQRAVLLAPQEALFYDELADGYAQAAVNLFEEGKPEAAQQYTALTKAAAEQTLELNPHHLNFYKSQSAIYSRLAVIDEQHLETSRKILLKAQNKAPTDPKLVYQQGLIEYRMGKQEQAIDTIKQAIIMKPDYHQARHQLGLIYEHSGNYTQALEQYQYNLRNLLPNDHALKERIENLQSKIKAREGELN